MIKRGVVANVAGHFLSKIGFANMYVF